MNITTSLLPVLMYHGLHLGERARGRYDPVYSVRPDEFARQLDWLLENGYRTARIGAPTANGGSKPEPSTTWKPVLITFDDGDVSNIEVALPLLRARGMSAEFFITTDFVGQAGMLRVADVRALAEAGMGIGAHGRSHRFLEDLDAKALDAELRDSRARLTTMSGQRVNALALPGGRGGERERRCALDNGYRYLFGSVPGPNRNAVNGHWLQRIAVTRNTDLATFAALVRWQGVAPRLARARFSALALPKRLLGNAGYERLRARLL